MIRQFKILWRSTNIIYFCNYLIKFCNSILKTIEIFGKYEDKKYQKKKLGTGLNFGPS